MRGELQLPYPEPLERERSRVMRVLVVAALTILLGQSFADETSDVLKSEVMLEELRTPLANLAQAVRRKKLAFDPVVKTVDLARSPTEGHEVLETGAVRRSWPAGRSGAGS
jgi:hypothetical protein